MSASTIRGTGRTTELMRSVPPGGYFVVHAPHFISYCADIRSQVLGRDDFKIAAIGNGQWIHGLDRSKIVFDHVVTECEPPFKIQAGHYYKTRDGRKLGPMKVSGLASFPWAFKGTFWTREGNHWTAGNEALDLIAEWQDEPADLTRGPESKWTDTEAALHAALQNCLAREPVNAAPQVGNALDTSKWTKLDWIQAAAKQRAVAYGILSAEPPASPVEPDWLPWSGGECPVHPQAYVEVRWPFPGNQERTPAWRCHWRNVTAYRVLWSPQEEKIKRGGETFLAVMANDAGDITYRTDGAVSALKAYARGCGIKVVAIVNVSWLEGDGL